MPFFQPFKEIQVVKHIKSLKEDQIKELQVISYGYLSSRINVITKRKWWFTIAYAEFTLVTLEGEEVNFLVHRLFGKDVSWASNLKLGDKIYTRAIPVKDPEERWYYVLEISPADKLSDFPLKYREYLQSRKQKNR